MPDKHVAGSAPIATATSSLPFAILRPRAAKMFGAVLLRLPMHAGGALVENLHAIAANIALACFRILGDHHRPRDVAAAILGPALQDRKIGRENRSFSTTSWHSTAAHTLREK